MIDLVGDEFYKLSMKVATALVSLFLQEGREEASMVILKRLGSDMKDCDTYHFLS